MTTGPELPVEAVLVALALLGLAVFAAGYLRTRARIRERRRLRG